MPKRNVLGSLRHFIKEYNGLDISQIDITSSHPKFICVREVTYVVIKTTGTKKYIGIKNTMHKILCEAQKSL